MNHQNMWMGQIVPTLWGCIAMAWNARGIAYSCLPEDSDARVWDKLEESVGARLDKTSLPLDWVSAWQSWEQGDESLLKRLPVTGLDRASFAGRVCLSLRDIPRGSVRTYGWIALEAESPRGAQAAGQALAANPLPLILPCHRIVQASGRLGGFSGARGRVDLKAQLLTWEGVQIKNGRVRSD